MKTTALDPRRGEGRKMMLDPMDWPRWPFLPVKRRSKEGSWPDCGFICAVPEVERWVVYEHSMYQLEGGKSILEQVPPEKRHTYQTVDEMLDAGWVVD